MGWVGSKGTNGGVCRSRVSLGGRMYNVPPCLLLPG